MIYLFLDFMMIVARILAISADSCKVFCVDAYYFSHFWLFTFDFFFTAENTEKHRKIISRKERNVSLFILLANVAGVARCKNILFNFFFQCCYSFLMSQ